MTIPGVTFDLVAPHEIEAAFALEEQAFPAEEAATLDKLQYRQREAPELFLGAFTWLPPMPRRLIGYVCATAASGTSLTHDSMSTHDASGKTVCVHSVVVHPTLQRRGLAVDMLKDYLNRLSKAGRYDRVSLLAHQPLVGLYQRASFELVGQSDVVHGPDPWQELTVELGDTSKRNPGTSYSAFASRPDVLLDASSSKSAVDFYCPRRQCRSLLLRKGHAEWSRDPLEPLRDPKAAPTPAAPDFPPPSPPAGPQPAWRVLPPSPMTFENISVSKTVPGAPGRKYLGCADCDCGPLGWLGPDEAILDASRLRYKLDST